MNVDELRLRLLIGGWINAGKIGRRQRKYKYISPHIHPTEGEIWMYFHHKNDFEGYLSTRLNGRYQYDLSYEALSKAIIQCQMTKDYSENKQGIVLVQT